MTASYSPGETKAGDYENQPVSDGVESTSIPPAADDHTGESPWFRHDYSNEPRVRDMPVRLLNLPRLLLLVLIRFYQVTLSRGLPPNTCRFYPSCSHYGYQAIYKYGVFKGSLMAAWRILRCNPFNRGGYDPVP